MNNKTTCNAFQKKPEKGKLSGKPSSYPKKKTGAERANGIKRGSRRNKRRSIKDGDPRGIKTEEEKP